MGERVKQVFGFCLLFRLVLCMPVIYDGELYEGDPCKLSGDRGDGTCVKFLNCPSKVQEVREGRYNDSDRCSFDHNIEIVCCDSVKIDEKARVVRPADIACQEYENEVSRMNVPTIGFNILGGIDAKANEFPQMAALGYAANEAEGDTPGTIKYTCGGTLISPQHVLTAAHCVSNIYESVPIEVRLGTTDLTDDQGTSQSMSILNITAHEKYRRSQSYHDIAIIKLSEPVRMTNSVHPACLMTRSLEDFHLTTNQTLVVAGWGRTEFAGELSEKLKKAAGLKLVNQKECASSYTNVQKLPNGLDDKSFCAIDPDRSRKADTCLGDSGGPLFITSESAQTLVAGITAFGQACGGSTPSVYTSVFSYLDWIEEHVWSSSGNEPTESGRTL